MKRCKITPEEACAKGFIPTPGHCLNKGSYLDDSTPTPTFYYWGSPELSKAYDAALAY